MPATFRCYQLKRSKDARKRCINLMSPKYSVIVAENKGFSSRNYLGLFLVDLGLFCHFFARPSAIALGSKPTLVTRIARTGLGTRLWFNWFIERIQTRVAFGWLSERSGDKTDPSL